jgi:hypothetical protein
MESRSPDDERKHRPKYVELTRINKLTCIVETCWLLSYLLPVLLISIFILNLDPASGQSTQHMTIPIAVYTELILLMMSSKPARNM